MSNLTCRYFNINRCKKNNKHFFFVHTNHGRLQVNHNRSRDVFSSSSFAEEGVEGIVAPTYSLITGHLAIGLNPMLQAVELPTRVTNLNPSLSDVNRNALSLKANNQRETKCFLMAAQCYIVRSLRFALFFKK